MGAEGDSEDYNLPYRWVEEGERQENIAKELSQSLTYSTGYVEGVYDFRKQVYLYLLKTKESSSWDNLQTDYFIEEIMKL